MNNLVIVPAEDLQALVEKAVSKGFSKISPHPNRPAARVQDADTDYLTTSQVADFLHCSRQHIQKLTREGKIKAYFFGLHNLYRRSELVDFVQSLNK